MAFAIVIGVKIVQKSILFIRYVHVINLIAFFHVVKVRSLRVETNNILHDFTAMKAREERTNS